MTPIALTPPTKKRRRHLDPTPTPTLTLPIPIATLPARLKPKLHPRSVRQKLSLKHPPRRLRLRRLLERTLVSRTCSLVT